MASREFNKNKWQKIISEYKNSCLSLKSYCLSKNVSLRCFYYWRSKLTSTENNKEEISFSEVSFRDEMLNPEFSEPKPACSTGIHVQIGKAHLTVDSNFDISEFKRTVKGLVDLSC